jgi:hypothetical protein
MRVQERVEEKRKTQGTKGVSQQILTDQIKLTPNSQLPAAFARQDMLNDPQFQFALTVREILDEEIARKLA